MPARNPLPHRGRGWRARRASRVRVPAPNRLLAPSPQPSPRWGRGALLAQFVACASNGASLHAAGAPMMFDLTGQTALITGASGGIGGAIARALHDQGAAVALAGTRAAALSALAGELGERAYPLIADLADRDAPAALIRS